MIRKAMTAITFIAIIVALVPFTGSGGSEKQENHPPVVEIIKPTQGETVSGVIIVKVKVSDHDGKEDINKTHVRIDQGGWNDAVLHGEGHDHLVMVYEWNTTAVNDGVHHVFAAACDGKDFGEEVGVEVTVNNQEPNHPATAEILAPLNEETVHGVVQVKVRAEDPDGNEDIKSVKVRIDDEKWNAASLEGQEHGHSLWIYEWNTTAFENGAHRVSAVACDGQGPGKKVVAEVFVKNEEPNHPPIVEIIAPAQGETIHGVVQVKVRAEDHDGIEEIDPVKVRIDEGEWINATRHGHGHDHSLWIYEWNTTTVDNGEHHIHAVALDDQEEGAIHTIGVIVKNPEPNHLPRVEIIEPVQGDTVGGVVEVIIAASDPDGNEDIHKVQVRINEGEWEKAALKNGEEHLKWVFRWNTTTTDNGQYHISAVAHDGKNSSEPHVIVVAVHNEEKNHPPRVEIKSPGEGEKVKGLIDISMGVWDEDENLDIVVVWIDFGKAYDATLIKREGNYTEWKYRWNTTTLENAEHFILVMAYDELNNSGEHAVTVFVHNEIPEGPREEDPHEENGTPGDPRNNETNEMNATWDEEDWKNAHRAEIRQGVREGVVAAEMTIGKEGRELKADTVLYLNGFEVEMRDPSDNRIDVIVRGEFNEGKVIVLNIDRNALEISDPENVIVRFDGKAMELSNFPDLITGEKSVPIYCITIGDDGMQILVRIPHFSVHKITIEGKGMTSPAPGSKKIIGGAGILALIAGIAVVLLLSFNVIRLGRRKTPAVEGSGELSGFLREGRRRGNEGGERGYYEDIPDDEHRFDDVPDEDGERRKQGGAGNRHPKKGRYAFPDDRGMNGGSDDNIIVWSETLDRKRYDKWDEWDW